MNEAPDKKNSRAALWIKRFGVAGFLFFLIKGLVWLTLIIAATYFGFDLFS